MWYRSLSPQSSLPPKAQRDKEWNTQTHPRAGGVLNVARPFTYANHQPVRKIVNKKERERLQRQQAEREKARAESEHRQQRIEVLWKALTSGSLAPKDKESADSELYRSLVELVQKQRCEIDYLREFWWICASHGEPRLGYPIDATRELQFLATLLRIGESQPFISKAASPYEYKRRGYARDGVGEIERQFGLGYNVISALSPFRPFCLDEIFKGAAVNMWTLQRLFGIHRNPLLKMFRNRFPRKLLPSFTMGREKLYDYRAVVMLMRALLSHEAPKRKASAPGRRGRKWLSDPNDPNRRTRVLNGIAERIKVLSVSGDIARSFLNVVRQYPPDSAKK